MSDQVELNGYRVESVKEDVLLDYQTNRERFIKNMTTGAKIPIKGTVANDTQKAFQLLLSINIDASNNVTTASANKTFVDPAGRMVIVDANSVKWINAALDTVGQVKLAFGGNRTVAVYFMPSIEYYAVVFNNVIIFKDKGLSTATELKTSSMTSADTLESNYVGRHYRDGINFVSLEFNDRVEEFRLHKFPMHEIVVCVRDGSVKHYLRKCIVPDNECCVCNVMLPPERIALIPCGHTMICRSCSNKVKTCPICRSVIEARQDLHF